MEKIFKVYDMYGDILYEEETVEEIINCLMEDDYIRDNAVDESDCDVSEDDFDEYLDDNFMAHEMANAFEEHGDYDSWYTEWRNQKIDEYLEDVLSTINRLEYEAEDGYAETNIYEYKITFESEDPKLSELKRKLVLLEKMTRDINSDIECLKLEIKDYSNNK